MAAGLAMAGGVAGSNPSSISPSQEDQYKKPSFNIEAPIVAMKHSTKGTGFDMYHKLPSDPSYNELRDKEWISADDYAHVHLQKPFQEYMNNVRHGKLELDLGKDELPQYNQM